VGSETLSVIMANYNHGVFLDGCLEAICTQSFLPKEFIIVDDGSTDNSVTIIEGFIKKHPKLNIILLRNETNRGVTYSINRAFDQATGDYVFWPASDDQILPGFFEQSMEILSEHPEAGLCCADSRCLLDENKLVENKRFLSERPRYFSPNEVVKLYKKEAFTPVIPSTVVIKRSVLKELGGYIEQFKWSCDSFAHNVASFRAGICYVPEILAVVRIHDAQYGSVHAKQGRLERGVIKLMIDTLLTPEYTDVLPKFQAVAPFSFYPWEVLMVVLGKRAYWGFFSTKLLRFALFDKFVRRLLLRLLPEAFCRFVINKARGLRKRGL